ncbi:ABC transporter ATP-binding protein [Rubripirellula amarantea]|uniref:ABC transporter ATP-binding protein n=1 Tax=Rubripirellula amarantea TaxID=2527999 RepID=UPI0036F322A1
MNRLPESETLPPRPTESVSTDASASIVVTTGLTKRYGDFEALSKCSVQVTRGEIFGLLGPNGAGKTTLIRLLLGYLQPTEGEISVDGFDPRVDGVSLRERVAYLPGDARLPRHMRGRSVLKFFSEMHPHGSLERSLAVAETLELNIATRVAFMSTGMRQKLALAVVFGVHTPLLILDEPTANLDPTVRAAVLDLAMEARDQGRTVMFSSHVLSEIEETCDRVVFLRKGHLAHQLTMDDLFQRHRITADWPANPLQVPEALAGLVKLSVRERRGGKTLCIDTQGDLAPLLSWVDSLSLNHVRIEPLGLRAVYDSVHLGTKFDATTTSGTSEVAI